MLKTYPFKKKAPAEQQAKIYINTVERRRHLAEATRQSLLDVGVRPDQIVIMNGYDKLDFPDMKKPYLLLTKAFKEKFLKYGIDNNISLFWTEDGTLFKKNPFEIVRKKEKINWLGYIRNLKDYIIGSKLIYFPLPIIKDMYSKNLRMAHLDRMIRNYALKHDKLVVSPKSHITQMDYPSDWGTEDQLKKKKILKKTIK